jgi:hypothetical protein
MRTSFRSKQSLLACLLVGNVTCFDRPADHRNRKDVVGTLDCAIKTARQDTGQDVFLMISWAHRRCIEGIVDVLTFR